MTYAAPPELLAMLRLHEGTRAKPYRDTKGILTIAVGRNLEAVGLSRAEVLALLNLIALPDPIITLMLANDIESVAYQVALVIGADVWSTLTPARQGALIDVGFMGVTKLAGFVKMIAAIRASDWQTAHDELLNSNWAHEVGATRSTTDAEILLTGTWPE
jgi:lysozyme